MRYFKARLTEETQTLKYRIYVTDALQGITNNTGRLGGGLCMNTRYFDFIKTEPQEEETRTSEEIIAHIKNKLKGLNDE